jgi:hypothetical protein
MEEKIGKMLSSIVLDILISKRSLEFRFRREFARFVDLKKLKYRLNVGILSINYASSNRRGASSAWKILRSMERGSMNSHRGVDQKYRRKITIANFLQLKRKRANLSCRSLKRMIDFD